MYLFALEPIFVIVHLLLSTGGELGDEIPTWQVQPFGVFLNLWCFQTHPFSDHEQHPASNSGFVDVSHVPVPCALDAFGGLAVDHHRARPNDFINFWRRRAVLQIPPVEPKFFLDPLNFRIGWLVVADVQLPANHVGDQNRQGLSRSTCGPNGSCKMNGNEL